MRQGWGGNGMRTILEGSAPATLEPALINRIRSTPLLPALISGLALGLGVAAPLRANDLGGQSAYRLSDPSERQVRANTLDLRERKQGGGFVFNTTNNIERQINCNFTVSATGNAASPTHAGAGIAPVGMQDSGLNAGTTGNQSQADSSASGVSNQVGQTNAGSTLTSGIYGSSTAVTLGDIHAEGAEILNAVDTAQSLHDSEVQANVEGSRACDFIETRSYSAGIP